MQQGAASYTYSGAAYTFARPHPTDFLLVRGCISPSSQGREHTLLQLQWRGAMAAEVKAYTQEMT